MNIVKKNLIFSISMLVLGIVILGIPAFVNMPDNVLGSSVFGMGCGLTSAGIGCTFMGIRTLKNPVKSKEAELNETDERNIFLREQSNSKVYSIFVYVECAGILLASILGYKDVVMVLSVLVLAKLIVWFIVCVNLSKKY